MRKSVTGVMTVYFSVVFLLLLSFLLSMLETARVYGLKLRLQLAVEGGMDSLFSFYQKPLFERYGLLLLDESFGEETVYEDVLPEMLETFMTYDLEQNTGMLLQTPQYYNMEITKVSVKECYRAMDGEGILFARSVLDFMKYREVSELVLRCTQYAAQLLTGEETYEALQEGELVLEQTDWGTTGEQNNSGGGSGNGATESDKNVAEEALEGSLIEQAKKWMESSLFQLFGISENALSNVKMDLSARVETIKSEEILEEGISKAFLTRMTEDVLYNEYVLLYLDTYMSSQSITEERAHPYYEVEYVLCGEARDRENLLETLGKMFALRLAMNSLYVVKSSKLCEETLLLSQSLVGWTGIPALAEVVQWVLLEVLAFTESVLDLRCLLRGGRVSFLKEEGDWITTLGNCLFVLENPVPAKENAKGLDYTWYLRILLFLMSDAKKYQRTMDVVEWNMQDVDKDFQIEECIYALEIMVYIEIPNVFARMLFWSPRRYAWKQRAARSY